MHQSVPSVSSVLSASDVLHIPSVHCVFLRYCLVEPGLLSIFAPNTGSVVFPVPLVLVFVSIGGSQKWEPLFHYAPVLRWGWGCVTLGLLGEVNHPFSWNRCVGVIRKFWKNIWEILQKLVLFESWIIFILQNQYLWLINNEGKNLLVWRK